MKSDELLMRVRDEEWLVWSENPYAVELHEEIVKHLSRAERLEITDLGKGVMKDEQKRSSYGSCNHQSQLHELGE